MSFQSVHFTDVVSQKYIGGVIGGVTRGCYCVVSAHSLHAGKRATIPRIADERSSMMQHPVQHFSDDSSETSITCVACGMLPLQCRAAPRPPWLCCHQCWLC